VFTTWANKFAPTCLLFWLGAAHADLPPPVAEALRLAGIPDSHVAAVVYDLDAAQPLLEHGIERSLNPASVMKLVTTLAALDSFGPAHTFKTRVLLDGTLKDGVLDGSLILQGGGDPGMTRERFWLLLREIRARGVREIRGDVVLGGGYYRLDPIDPAAFDDAPLRPYNAAPAALLVDFNTVSLRIAGDETGVQARLDPPLISPALANQMVPGDGPCNGQREQIALAEATLTLNGRYPTACGDQAIALNLLPPEATAAAWFRRLWSELGGRLAGDVVSGEGGNSLGNPVPSTVQLLFEFDSPTVAHLVRDTNKFSNNVMAKMLFLNLGAARYGAPATWDKGERALRAWLAERDLECGKLVLENGSGLSRIERISAFALARLLRWATRQPTWFEFAASLPAVGVEGTQRNRLNGSAARGQAWLKSGSLKGVRNLAGYARTPNGGRRVVVFLINHGNAEAGGRAQDTLIEWATDTLGGAADRMDSALANTSAR
jgi:D-alanyl-D-alanine carboxypeptidase/D-alanyl-D-alanine-endopeptidase (penicillin-binding protein 4)